MASEDDNEQEEAQNQRQVTENESINNEQNDETGAYVETSASNVQDSIIQSAGGNLTINHYHVRQVRDIFKENEDVRRSLNLPPPPPADASLQERVNYWFTTDLETQTEKFTAVTLSIFHGLDYPSFKDVLDSILSELKVEERAANDYRKSTYFNTEDDDLLAKIHAEIKPTENGIDEIISFKDEKYVSAIFDLLRNRFRNVLIKMLPAIKLIVERHQQWSIRVNAAYVMAELSKTAFTRIQTKVYDVWAHDKRAYVRAAVGYPLARLAETPETRERVVLLLDEWVRKSARNWHVGWTAASVCKQIGLLDSSWGANTALSYLKDLAGKDHIKIADSVIHSLVVMSLNLEIPKLLSHIRVWLMEGSAGTGRNTEPQTRCFVAIVAFIEISNLHMAIAEDQEAKEEMNRLNVDNLFDLIENDHHTKGEIWQLMITFGVRSYEFSRKNEFMTLMADWTKLAQDDAKLQNTIRDLLRDLHASIRPKFQSLIVNRMKSWSKNRNHYVAEMGESVQHLIQDTPASADGETTTPLNIRLNSKIKFGSSKNIEFGNL